MESFKDNENTAYYNYDASGERNFKLTGDIIELTQNGVPYNYAFLESPTLYASGLITINERGYTKHYFEENKRVCSNIGGGFRDAGYDITEPIGLITSFEEQLGNAKDGIFNTFEQCIKSPVDHENTQDKIVNVMKDHEKDRNEEEYQFYYTNDHLGSSTYITNKEGQITQTLAYLPYGEDWVDLDNHPPYLTPYKFNGKEKDQETGYQYFGARYLNPKLSIWLSVDPLSDKYPSLTPYNYCANNPVMLIDPDGMKCVVAEDDQEFVNQLLDQKSDKYHAGFAEKYNELHASDHVYKFESVKADGFKDENGQLLSGLFTSNKSPNESLIQFTKGDNPDVGKTTIGASEYRALFEETFHAFQFEKYRGLPASTMKEAEAWQFSATAPGTKFFYKDNKGNYNKTVMGNILFASQRNVSNWLKNGKDFGNGVKLNALYKNLPEDSSFINFKIGKIENPYKFK